ncbi:hypothetical protein DPMN_096555 [Dreissena polymorpha]|uniref:Uncharacterized protein n=1 Tax=Dreissena polymorpha TaxID=45954 RepID=A0A9D4L9E4_DREPO|nr:hypothetical protein DPMN_096555 [Dreissena polymorpha]
MVTVYSSLSGHLLLVRELLLKCHRTLTKRCQHFTAVGAVAFLPLTTVVDVHHRMSPTIYPPLTLHLRTLRIRQRALTTTGVDK